MFNLFINAKSRDLDFLRADKEFIYEILGFNIERSNTYNKNRVAKVDNNHILSMIINNLDYSYEKSIYDWIRYIDSRKDYSSRISGVVTDKYKGEVLDSKIFENSKEIILEVSEDLDITKLKENWKTLTPLKIIYHEMEELKYVSPSNEIELEDNSIIVMTLDIKMMLLQFREFCLEMKYLNRGINVSEFIFRYVLNNSIYSFTDILVFNMFIKYSDLGYDFTNYLVNKRNPITYLSVEDKLINFIKNSLVRINSRKNEFYIDVLSVIPLLTGDADDVLKINKNYYNRNSKWVLYVSRIRYILFLLNLLGEDGIRKNLGLISSLRIEIKYYKRESSNMIPNLDIKKEFEILLDKVKNIIGEY